MTTVSEIAPGDASRVAPAPIASRRRLAGCPPGGVAGRPAASGPVPRCSP